MILFAAVTAAGLATAAMVTTMIGTAVTAAGAIYSGIQSNRAAKQQAKAAEQQAAAQAAESERQAKLENERAAVAQVQGEQEAEKRSRALAADIGSTYANAAGNGLMVDGSSLGDSLGKVLTSQVTEGQADISTIKDNTAMNVWTHQTNANSYLASAANTRIAGENTASSLRAQGKSALIGGFIGATGSAIKGAASVANKGESNVQKYGSMWG